MSKKHYKLLLLNHRDIIDIYMKATGFWLFLSIAGLGFIFKGDIIKKKRSSPLLTFM